MHIDDIRALTHDDMQATNRLIEESLHTNVELIDQISQYIINSGGKRLRPMLTLMAARACGVTSDQHYTLAAIIEFIHTATLLHDDVVDESAMRRGNKTANNVWGNQAAVLVGDFLYSRSFQLMVKIGNMDIMDILADATNTIAEGEVLQLINQHDPKTDQARYIKVIDCKTAKLFEAATDVGAVASGNDQYREAMRQYGMGLGRAYQLVDDVLDYSATSEELGKNIGDDLAEGKPTLPLIHVMKNGSPHEKSIVEKAIREGGLDDLEAIQAAIQSTGALDYTAQLARDEAENAKTALAALPDSEWKAAMIGLVDFAVARSY